MTMIERAWNRKAGWLLLLWPLSVQFRLIARIRREFLQRRTRPVAGSPAIVVVGNLTVGGTGKTPALIGLVEFLRGKGLRPGIISRGYGGQHGDYPLIVKPDTPSAAAGDEPVLIARVADCPVVVDPNRLRALNCLLAEHKVDVVLSDDGLQHYRLPRDVEICVVDGQRLFGNGMCLPAGPLREPVSRLESVDFILINGESSESLPQLADAARLEMRPRYLINMSNGEKRPFGGAPFKIGNTIQAVAAIGNPERFYNTLESLPYPLKKFSFPDHHMFQAEDFTTAGVDQHQPIVMTEKDAVKCEDFAGSNFWYLESKVELPENFLLSIYEKIMAVERLNDKSEK